MQIKYYASQLWCNTRFCGRSHLVVHLLDRFGIHFATTYNTNYLIYADEFIRIYISFKPNQADAALSAVFSL